MPHIEISESVKYDFVQAYISVRRQSIAGLGSVTVTVPNQNFTTLLDIKPQLGSC